MVAMTDAEKTKQLRKEVAPFAKSQTKKSVIQIINTMVPLIVLCNFHRG